MSTSENFIDVGNRLGSFLSSRDSGAEIRELLVRAKCVTRLDFSRVESVSDSFADEAFAVLVQELGHEWFASNVKIVGLSKLARLTILRAIHLRTECEPA